MFSPQTEEEIIKNITAVAFRSPITLSVHAYEELLFAARQWYYHQSSPGSSARYGSVVLMREQPDGSFKIGE